MALQIQDLVCNSGKFRHYYLCHYRPKASGSDELSKSIIQFKNGNSVHLNVWIECAVLELGKAQIKKGSTIVRALGLLEQEAVSGTSLDILCNRLAENFEAQYTPSLLKKTATTTKMAWLKRHERAEALFNRYSFSGNDLKEILVIDDILTTGATICAIAKSIRTISNSCTIKIFTLAATSSDSRLNDSLKLGGFFNPGQLEGRLPTVQGDVESYSEPATLRSKILDDSFY